MDWLILPINYFAAVLVHNRRKRIIFVLYLSKRKEYDYNS